MCIETINFLLTTYKSNTSCVKKKRNGFILSTMILNVMRSATPVRTTAIMQSPRTTVSLEGVRRQDDDDEEEEEEEETFREDHVKFEFELVVVVEVEVAEEAPYDGRRPKSVVVVSGRLCAARGCGRRDSRELICLVGWG